MSMHIGLSLEIQWSLRNYSFRVGGVLAMIMICKTLDRQYPWYYVGTLNILHKRSSCALPKMFTKWLPSGRHVVDKWLPVASQEKLKRYQKLTIDKLALGMKSTRTWLGAGCEDHLYNIVWHLLMVPVSPHIDILWRSLWWAEK